MFQLNLKFEMSAKLLKQIRNLGFLIFLLLEAPTAVMANDNFIPLPSPLNKDADILTYYWDW